MPNVRTKEESKARRLVGKGRWFGKGGRSSEVDFPTCLLLMGMSSGATGAKFQIPSSDGAY